MSPYEIYLWTALPRIGDHLLMTAGFSVTMTLLSGFIFIIGNDLDGEAPMAKRMFTIALIVASLSGIGHTLCPNDKQVKQILARSLVP